MTVKDQSSDSGPEKPNDGAFPVVGIGASAGGLEAFTQLLRHLPVDTGMGFVLVQHLDPVHESALPKLLSRATSMPVGEVTNNTRVEPDHVYVIPPNTSMSIARGFLKLLPRQKTDGQHRSIDSFFQSLAEDQHERSIGVVLSGTASDGSLGCEAIKAEGGITFAQDESAKYDSMPRSAIAAGCIDFVLSPENIAKELAQIAKHPYVMNASGQAGPALHAEAEREADQLGGPDAPLASGGRGTPRTGSKRAKAAAAAKEGRPGSDADGFKKILLLLRNHCGVDFSLYKSSTIQRRVTRRLVLNKQNTPDEYAAFLKGNAKELDALYSDVLISVTSFFRNPEAFETLKRKVFPELLAQHEGDEPLRVWTLGCSTGQEAYSVAMSFAEFSENVARAPKLQIFATDLNDALLEKARHGLYTKTLAQDVSPDRLRRFFVEEEGGYRVSKPLRQQVVFARQNVISDPPFSRIDLISCRNLLIYLEAGLQKKIMPAFHYALKPGGFLFLGASESTAGFTELFEPADRKQKIFAKKAAPTPAFRLPLPQERAAHPSRQRLSPVERPQDLPEGFRDERDAQREADRISVSQFAPPGVLINAELQVLQFRGATGAYLAPPTGKASFDLLKMARPGLMLPLRAAINKAKRENKRVRRENVQVKENGGNRAVDLQVIPLRNLREHCYLILFEEAKEQKTRRTVSSAPSTESIQKRGAARTVRATGKKEESRRVAELERELSETRDYLQSIQEQHEAANEELQASGEEVQSANEELQSINEELETSKEELESTNEELTTVNEEMQNRNQELNRLNSDLNNLHNSVNVSIVVLGRDLTIRRFTPVAEKELNLLATDIGQPISRIKTNLDFPELEKMVAEVIETVSVRETEVQDKEGRYYSLRVHPYVSLDNKIDGAVLVLVNITELKQTEQRIKDERNYAQAIIRTVPQPLVVLDGKLRLNTANESFYRTFQVSPQETEGRLIYDLGNRQWDIPALRELLEEILPKNTFFADYEVTHDFRTIGPRTMLLSASRLEGKDGTTERILLSAQDITERKQSEEALRESAERIRFMAESMPQKIFTAKPNGDIDYFNELWMEFTGLSLEQIRDWGWTQVIHADDVEENVRVWKHAIDTGEPFQFEHRFRRKDGVYRWHLSRAEAMRDAEGKVLMWIGSNTDIDDIKGAEGELKALMLRERQARAEAEVANRVKDEFLAMISHELRTPLNAITGWVHLLQGGKLDQETAKRAIETINSNAKAQATIINSLLDTARIISGKLLLDQQAVNLIGVIEAAMEVVRPASDAKGIEIIAVLDPAAGPVAGDAVRLQQVIWNLLSNAIKFTPKEGHVKVQLDRAGTNVAIVVKDTGQGISPDFLPHMFERFRQADSTTTRLHGGLGLGLSIVRHLVEMHGGSISAESDGEAQGATFTVTLPIMAVTGLPDSSSTSQTEFPGADFQSRTEETAAREAAARNVPSNILDGLRVLVVDDQTDTLELVTFALTRYSAEVRVSKSAKEALKVVEDWKPDIIVSDIGMPGEDGYELMNKIRALTPERGGQIPAVALTGYASPADESKALAAGYQAHLSKPVDLDELAATIAKFSGRQ